MAYTKEELQERYGEVMTTDEMTARYEAIGFQAPFVLVREKKTGTLGTLAFQHEPRFYFGWKTRK